MPITANVSGALRRVRRARKVAREPFGSGRGADCVRAMRRETVNDMRSRRYVGPRGGGQRWKKRVGDPWPKSDPPLRALVVAWRGGAGGGQRIEPRRRVAIYVIPHWASVHTGGRGTDRNPGKVTRIGVTERMRGFLAAAFGIRLSPAKTHIEVPARSHAAATPELRRELAKIVRRDL